MMTCVVRVLDKYVQYLYLKATLGFNISMVSGCLLSGWDFRLEFGPNGKITLAGWAAVHRLVKILAFKIYGKSTEIWRHIFQIEFAARKKK